MTLKLLPPDPILSNNPYKAALLQKSTEAPLLLKYIIAALPRSGSNLLTRSFRYGGVGLPAEYFHPQLIQALADQAGCDTFNGDTFFNFLLTERRCSAGIFGAKFHWEQFEQLKPNVREKLIRNCRVIFTRRRDLAMQTLSLETALQTGRWDPRWEINLATIQPDANPRNYKRLKIIANVIVGREVRWLTYFKENSIQPINVFYEDYLADINATHQRIYRELDVEGPLPPVEPAPEGKTGSTTEELEIVARLREQIADIEARRPSLN